MYFVFQVFKDSLQTRGCGNFPQEYVQSLCLNSIVVTGIPARNSSEIRLNIYVLRRHYVISHIPILLFLFKFQIHFSNSAQTEILE